MGVKLGNGKWAIKEDKLLAYNDNSGKFFNKEFDFSRGSSATYVAKDGLIKTAGLQTDTPRIDFSDTVKGALLLEPSSTQLIQYSEQFSQWGTVNGVVVTDNFATSPDGTQNAAKVVYDGTSLGRIEISTSASGTNTQSIYLKTVSGTQAVSIGSSSSDLTEVTVTSEWQRFTHTGSGSYPRVLCNDATTIFVWGAMLEQKSFSTSYIPNHGVSGGVTRLADVCINSGSAQDFNDSEGVLYAEIAALANNGTARRISLNDGTTNNTVEVRYTSNNNQIQFVIRDNGTVTVSPSINISNVLEFNKIALRYKADDCKMYINGVRERTDTNCTMPSGLNRLSFNWGGSNPFYGKVRAVQVFTEALTDEQLEKLTTI